MRFSAVILMIMGYTVMTTLKKHFDELGGELLLETRATDLLTDETGKVIGVTAEGKDAMYTIYATGGVVLATGGFEHDQAMVEKYAPHYAKNRSFGGNAGDDGDAILMCEKVGADFAFPGYGMDDSGYAVVVVDPIIKNGGGVQYIGYTTVEVDGITGKRFHNERSNFETAEMDGTGHFNDIWCIFDSTRSADILEQLDTAVENGYAYKADTFEELAEQVGMPVEHLSRVFKQDMQISFSDYLLKIRMKEAQRLLRETPMSAAEIARHVGFLDAAYFHRIFHKQFGMTPRQYRTLSS